MSNVLNLRHPTQIAPTPLLEWQHQLEANNQLYKYFEEGKEEERGYSIELPKYKGRYVERIAGCSIAAEELPRKSKNKTV